jgi:hypothetical protein
MGNIVKVSRAPRLKFVCPNHAGFYVDVVDMRIWCNTDRGMVCLDNDSFRIKEGYDWHHKFVRLELLGDVIKWVAGGRKLEDLQVDAKDEWVDVKSLPLGSIAEVVSDSEIPQSKWVGKTFIRIVDNVTVLETGEQMRGLGLPFMVWPLGPGDSITIEPDKP